MAREWSQTPIVIASGADAIDLVEKSRALGAVDFLMKPFDQELFRQAMERAAKAIPGQG
jgi:FixJ family two-component response regulator